MRHPSTSIFNENREDLPSKGDSSLSPLEGGPSANAEEGGCQNQKHKNEKSQAHYSPLQSKVEETIKTASKEYDRSRG